MVRVYAEYKRLRRVVLLHLGRWQWSLDRQIVKPERPK